MQDLKTMWHSMNKGTCAKWEHYFEIYERYISKYRNQPVNYLEIGVQAGGSLELMRNYLGEQAHIVGIDIDPACANVPNYGSTIHIGSQEDRAFLKSVAAQHPQFDIIIDDGGHTAQQQITSFEELWPHLKFGGVYIVEDLHCSQWWPRFGAGTPTFLDYAHGLANRLSKWHTDEHWFHNRYSIPREQRNNNGPQVTDFATREIFSISYYDSIIAIEKRAIGEPFQTRK